jgi:hypothetical protein
MKAGLALRSAQEPHTNEDAIAQRHVAQRRGDVDEDQRDKRVRSEDVRRVEKGVGRLIFGAPGW